MPERQVETIPDGLGPKDVRVAAVATQPDVVRGKEPASDSAGPPAGHREVAATDDTQREAGQSR